MAHNYYTHYKNKHDKIKPIRGRAEEVRPIGDRRRDGERIEMDGEVVACRLYQTQVVRYYPDGRIGLRIGGWSTSSTAEFMEEHSPFRCSKTYRRVWVHYRTDNYDTLVYPMPANGEVILSPTPQGNWVMDNPLPIFRKAVDRVKSKTERAALKPFLSWAKTFMKMSDGWLMHDTRKAALGFENGTFMGSWDISTHAGEAKLYAALRSGDEEHFLPILSTILDLYKYSDAVAGFKKAETVEVRGNGYIQRVVDYHDMRYVQGTVDLLVTNMMRRHGDIYSAVRVQAGHKPMTDTIDTSIKEKVTPNT